MELTIENFGSATPDSSVPPELIENVWECMLHHFPLIGCDVSIIFYGENVVEAWITRAGVPVSCYMLTY